MEALMKKLKQKYKRAGEEISRWDELQSRLISQFSNAASIIERLEAIGEPKNYGVLRCVEGISDTVLSKQLDTLGKISLSMGKTLEELNNIVISLDKIARDGSELLRGGSTPTAHQMQSSLSQCLNGLKTLHEMHRDEYLLKSSIISSLSWKCSATDLAGLRQLLVDQPNIPKAEVHSIFDIIFPEEMIC